MNDTIAAKLEHLPDRPGVYLFRNASGAVVYAGKALSLRQRVRSYFQKNAAHTPKTLRMLEEAEDIELLVTDSETEAFLLENHVIKAERPRYNVILTDDKNYPYLKVSVRDEYPRVSLVRRVRSDGNLYFGPFLPASVAWRTLRMMPKYFRIAICHVKFDGKQRPCLYYHLGQCLAPCAGYTNPQEYGEAVADARLFLEGKNGDLVASLEGRMREAAGEESFELAAHYRDLAATMRRMSEKQVMSSAGLENQDVFADHREGERVALQLFQMREGRVVSRREFFFEGVEEPPGDFYRTILAQHYSGESVFPSDILLPAPLPEAELLEAWLAGRAGRRVRLLAPQRGPRKRLLDLVRRNAALAFRTRFHAGHNFGVRVLEELRNLLELDEVPYRIECFDVSNIQGTDPVASMVAWEGGQPRRSDYRRLKIRTVEGADDFRALAEAVGRRYARLQKENRRLPDLVLIDGGRGQLSSAVAALDALGLGDLPVASIAKKEEAIFVQGRGEPLRLPRDSPVLQLVQRIRDEAHRFAVSYHRKLRDKRTLTSELLEIKGVGPATARRLLSRFGSVEGVRGAPREEIESVCGARIARAVEAHLASRRDAV